MKRQNYIIFSDLDGTLLDHDTYLFDKALPAIEFLKRQHIPLILTSSKTCIEMAEYQKSMGIEEYPFIVENGSAVFTSFNYFNHILDKEQKKNYDCYTLGKTYSEIKNFLEKISVDYDYNIQGFHNTDKNEIAKRTNMSAEKVDLAMQREFSIPLFYDDKAREILEKEIHKHNLKMLFGGRFMHLLGNTDKGNALELVSRGYLKKENHLSFKTIAIGDTLNDEAMLKKADIKILVKRFNNEYDKRVKVDNLIYSPYIGPKGWNHSILEILEEAINHE